MGAFGGPECPEMEPSTHPKRSCEPKRAEEERKSAEDDAESDPEATSAAYPGGRGQRPGVTLAGTVKAAIPRKATVSPRRERNSRKAAWQTLVTSTSKTSLLFDL